MNESRAPLLSVFVLLSLAASYVGGYLALVKPGGGPVVGFAPCCVGTAPIHANYHVYADGWTARIFRPLEMLDRKLRPAASWSIGHPWSRLLKKKRYGAASPASPPLVFEPLK